MAQPFSTSASSSASTSYPGHDVFLNHRGPDCKHTFAIRLYRRLRYQGLRVFLDSEELIEGKNITSQLEAAIKEASVQVAIFSPTYAKSEWCLNELVLMVNSGATILPVFYDVEPSMVRSATGTYGEALQNLQQKRKRDPQTGELKPRYDLNTVQSWRDALLRVGGISGFVLHGDEFELLEKVVQSVRKNVPKTPLYDVPKTPLYVATYPTGLDQKLRDLERMVEPELQESRPVGAKIVGIVGVGGVGKTTLAKHFFNLKRSDYNASCFLFDVRENARTGSLNYLQSQLIQELKHTEIKIRSPDQGIGELIKHLSSCKRVLIILDDIDHKDQMEKLLPMKDSLSQESLILVTSRDRHVLRLPGLEEKSIYYLKGLDGPDSKVLFCSHAFFQSYPPEEFAVLVDRFVKACDGLPLSLKVFGALVCEREPSYWKEMLDRLPTEIQERLRISYESLEEEDQKTFLDIVYFFIGEKIDTAIRIWGVVGLENLESKCLLEVDSEKKIKMHDHIRDMGRIIAKQGSLPRRLSQIDDFLEQTSSGMTEVRGISMVPRVPDGSSGLSESHLKDAILKNPKCKLFHKDRYDCMNLKFLATEGDYLEAILRRVPAAPLLWLRWDRILRRVPSAPLLWLRWYHCPYSSLPSWVPMENLRVLEVAGSRLETLWQLESQAPLRLRELNIFSPLSHFPKSIGQLNHLEKIFVGHESCILRLKSLPEEFCNLHSLKCLTLQSCSVLVSLPDSFGRLTSLQRINLNRASSLMTLPNSFENLTNLQHFELSGASKLETLPNSFGKLTNLRHFELSGASKLETLPNSFGKLTNLQHFTLLNASRLETLPNSFGNLTNLRNISLSNISLSDTATLEMLPLQMFSGNLIYLNINLSVSGASSLVPLPLLLPNASGIIANVYMAAGFHGDIFGDIENLYRTIDSQNVNINMSGASKLERIPPTNVFGNVRNVDITFSLSGASTLERLPLTNFFGDIENFNMTVDFQNVNINMSSASSLERLQLTNVFGNVTNVRITLCSGASTLERLPLTNFFGDIENFCMTVDFLNVNINMSSASTLERLQLTNVFGNAMNVMITFSLSGAFILESLPLTNFIGDIENFNMMVDFLNVNINMSSASSLERLQLTNVFGNASNVNISLLCSDDSTLERLQLANFVGDIENFNISTGR